MLRSDKQVCGRTCEGGKRTYPCFSVNGLGSCHNPLQHSGWLCFFDPYFLFLILNPEGTASFLALAAWLSMFFSWSLFCFFAIPIVYFFDPYLIFLVPHP